MVLQAPCITSGIVHSPYEGRFLFLLRDYLFVRPYIPYLPPTMHVSVNQDGMRRHLFLETTQACADIGRVALQELWCGTKRMDGTFLHSPLLDELKSLEITLMRQAYRQRRIGHEGIADGSVGSSAAVQSAIEKAPSVSVDLPSQVMMQPACSSAFLSSMFKSQSHPKVGCCTEVPIGPHTLSVEHFVGDTRKTCQLFISYDLVQPCSGGLEIHQSTGFLKTAKTLTCYVQGPVKAERIELPMLPSIAPGAVIEQFPGSCSKSPAIHVAKPTPSKC